MDVIYPSRNFTIFENLTCIYSLYAIIDNFDCFPCISLHQYKIILTLISISRGYLPNSPYTMKLGMDIFRHNKKLQNFKCTLSIISFLPDPQISHPYNKIGFTILSNKSNWHLIDK
jgi:hypothetical protein